MNQFILPAHGASLFCRQYGRGAPVVMVHGACVDSNFFLDTAQLLAQWFSVYIYDRRGYGQSEMDENGNHSISTQTEDLAALIQSIGVPCHIIAHSGGTVLVMELASNRPELVRKILLYEPIDAECVDSESEMQRHLGDIRKLVRRGNFGEGLCRFIPYLGEKDERGNAATATELKYSTQNCRCFIQYEFESFFWYAANAAFLQKMDISIGIGELSHGTWRWDVATNLIRKLDADQLYFPGAHSCPRDLPKEFALLSAGILSK